MFKKTKFSEVAIGNRFVHEKQDYVKMSERTAHNRTTGLIVYDLSFDVLIDDLSEKACRGLDNLSICILSV